MAFLIGGFSFNQYKNYLQPSNIATGKWSFKNAMHFNSINYPILTIFLNRLAYFIIHHFSAYPNNAYLFEKFKSHDFTTIQNQDQVKAAKQILNQFKNCLELNQKEFIKIKENVKSNWAGS